MSPPVEERSYRENTDSRDADAAAAPPAGETAINRDDDDDEDDKSMRFLKSEPVLYSTQVRFEIINIL